MKSIPKQQRQINQDVLDEFRDKPCVICGKPSDPCHIKSRGSGGDDAHSNLISFCRTHHQQQHAYGWAKLCFKYPLVVFVLEKKGWVFEKLHHGERLIRK